MSEPSLFIRRIRLLAIVFVAWSITLIFATFTAQVALKLPINPKDSIALFVQDTADPDILYWPFIIAALIAYILGPVALAITLIGAIMAKFRRAQPTSAA